MAENETLLLGCVAAAADASTVANLASRLSASGVRLAAATTNVDDVTATTVVVVLSPALAADPVAVASVSALYDRPGTELVPVSIDQGAGDLLADLSHIRVATVGLGRAAERIALVARTGSRDLAAWNALSTRAHQWRSGGRHPSDLLGRSDLDHANRLLLRPIARLASDDRSALSEFTAASQRRLRRRTAALGVLAAAIAVTLVATSATAVAQRSDAQAEERRADATSATAQAQRLIQLADELVTSDPDLPWMLLARAVEVDASQDVRAQAARIASQLVPHRTIDLRAPAVALASHAGGGSHLAVVYVGSAGVDVIDARTGRVVGSYQPGVALDSVALSPDGEQLLVATANGETRLMRVDSGSESAVDALAGAQLLAWSEEGRFAGARGSTLILADSGGSEVMTVEIGEEVTTVASSGNGRVVVGTQSELVLVDAAAATVVGRVPWTDVLSVGQSPAVDEFLVRERDVIVRLPLAAFEDRAVLEGAQASGVRAITRTMGETSRFPVPVGDSSGTVSVVVDGATRVTGDFVAHHGPVVGIAEAPDGRWITVGGDGKLRLWEPDQFDEVYPGGDAMPPELTGLGVGPDQDELMRSVIQGASDRGLVTVGRLHDFSAYVLDRVDLSVMHEAPVGMASSPFELSSSAGRGLRINFANGSTYLWDIVTKDLDDLPPSPCGGLTLQSAISPDERWVAVACVAGIHVLDRSATARTWDASGFVGDEQPIAMEVDDEGEAWVLTSSGRLVSTEGVHRQLGPEGVRIAAARSKRTAVGDRAVLVSGDGRVFVGTRREVRETGTREPDLGPIAVRVSPSGELAAIVGRTTTVVIALDSGRVEYEWRSNGRAYDAIEDVDFDQDGRGAVLIRANGAVSRWTFPAMDDVDTLLDRWVPRLFTDEELSTLALESER